MLEYGTITSVFSSETGGAQLCHVKGHLTDREYQNCEIITPKGFNYLPSQGDLVIVSEIHNSEVVVLGVLEPSDFSLNEGEFILHNGENINNGQIERYDMKTRIKFTKEGEIEISKGSSSSGQFQAVSTIKMAQNGDIEMSTTGDIKMTANSVTII